MIKIIGWGALILFCAINLRMAEAKDAEESLSQIQKTQMINQIHHMNGKEMALSQIGRRNAESQEVKGFADQMLQDHQDLDKKLMKVAQAENIQVQPFQ